MAQQQPLMPVATAVWLIQNTTLTFVQIADFCGNHELEIQAIADGEVAPSVIGMSPVVTGQLSAEEIKRCEDDPRARLKMLRHDLPQVAARGKGPRYTPVTKRADKPDGVAFLVKTYPHLQDAQIARLIGTTKETIEKIRSRTHWNTANIKPRDPILLGLCKRIDLEAAVAKADRRVARETKAAAKSGEPAPHSLVTELVTEAPEPEDDFSPTNPFATSVANDNSPLVDQEPNEQQGNE